MNYMKSQYFLKKCLALRAELGKRAKNIVLPRRFQHFKICHFGEILAIQYMSFWGDFRVKIKNNETLKKKTIPTFCKKKIQKGACSLEKGLV